MKKEGQKEIETGYEPTRWIVPELRKPPTFMTLYPRITLDDIHLPCVGELTEPKLFHVDEIEIV